MAGNRVGGRKAARTNKERYGDDVYVEMGRLGGSVPHPDTRWFAVNREAAKLAGQKGGMASRRGVT